jgi:tetratricopeptide (TPR) repeat protein
MPLPNRKLEALKNWLPQAVTIAAAVLAVYWPALHGDWLWDDDTDITANTITHSPTGLLSIWFTPGSQLDYYPIKASVQWVQWHLFGQDTFGYHLTNIILHLIGALLTWRLLGKFNLKFAWLGGLIFAVHPVNVESVAWIAELKNVLSLPPFLLAMCAWIDFDERGKGRDYFLALGLFVVAMLCKTSMVTFPIVLLLYAWWKRGAIGWGDLKMSAPFFLVSLGLGLVTMFSDSWYAQFYHQQVDAHPIGGPLSRLALAGLTFSFYLADCLWPVGLCPIYPRWSVDPPSPLQFLPWLILAGLFWLLWHRRRTWGRHVALGLGFFGIMLAPFLGFMAIGYMDFTWVMDHFLYLPIIGVIGLAVAGFDLIYARSGPDLRIGWMIGVSVIMALLAFGSWSYAGNYIDSATYWEYTVERNPDAWRAHNNFGYALFSLGHLSEAREEFERALELNPNYAEAHNNLANAMLKVGQIPEALEQFQEAVRCNPNCLPPVYSNIGSVLIDLGRFQEAVEKLEAAVQAAPQYPDAHYNLGVAFEKMRRIPEAIEQYRQAIHYSPDSAAAHNNLGNLLIQTAQLPEAIEHLQTAVTLDPKLAVAYFNLGNAYLMTGRTKEAFAAFEEALKLKPDYAQVHYNMAIALANLGQTAYAIAEYETVLKIDPYFPGAREGLAKVQKTPKTIPPK